MDSVYVTTVAINTKVLYNEHKSFISLQCSWIFSL